MPQPREALVSKIESMETDLGKEQDETKKSEIETQLTESKTALAELDEALKHKEKDVVPLYKFKKANDSLKILEAKLKEIEAEKEKAKEAESKKKGDYETLLSQKDEKITGLMAEAEFIKETMKKEKIKSLIIKEANKFNPHDGNDVLSNIDMSNIDINDDDGKITINGIEKEINSLKESKPYLFKAKEDDNKILGENSKISSTPDAIEIEFRKLYEKDNLTPREQLKLGELGKQLEKIKLAKLNKT